MTNRNTARQAIMKEVEAALAEDDLLTVERIMARLSSTRIEKIIEDAVERDGALSRGRVRRKARGNPRGHGSAA